MAAVRPPDDMDLVLENQPSRGFPRRIQPALRIGLDDLDKLFLSIDENAAPLIDVMGHGCDRIPVEQPGDGRRPGEGGDDPDPDRVPGRADPGGRIKVGNAAHLGHIESRIRPGQFVRSAFLGGLGRVNRSRTAPDKKKNT